MLRILRFQLKKNTNFIKIIENRDYIQFSHTLYVHIVRQQSIFRFLNHSRRREMIRILFFCCWFSLCLDSLLIRLTNKWNLKTSTQALCLSIIFKMLRKPTLLWEIMISMCLFLIKNLLQQKFLKISEWRRKIFGLLGSPSFYQFRC